jgi:hypothetical protein
MLEVRYYHWLWLFYGWRTDLLGLTDIGNIPYSLARPFLIKVESPKQLVSLSQSLDNVLRSKLTVR